MDLDGSFHHRLWALGSLWVWRTHCYTPAGNPLDVPPWWPKMTILPIKIWPWANCPIWPPRALDSCGTLQAGPQRTVHACECGNTFTLFGSHHRFSSNASAPGTAKAKTYQNRQNQGRLSAHLQDQRSFSLVSWPRRAHHGPPWPMMAHLPLERQRVFMRHGRRPASSSTFSGRPACRVNGPQFWIPRVKRFTTLLQGSRVSAPTSQNSSLFFQVASGVCKSMILMRGGIVSIWMGIGRNLSPDGPATRSMGHIIDATSLQLRRAHHLQFPPISDQVGDGLWF